MVVIDAFRTAFQTSELRIYGVDGHFQSTEDARRQPLQVAAANWMASATLVGRPFSEAIFVDVGSATTGIIPIAPAASSRTLPRKKPVHRRATSLAIGAAAAQCALAADVVRLLLDLLVTKGAVPCAR